jgi:hypothetical protein
MYVSGPKFFANVYGKKYPLMFDKSCVWASLWALHFEKQTYFIALKNSLAY